MYRPAYMFYRSMLADSDVSQTWAVIGPLAPRYVALVLRSRRVQVQYDATPPSCDVHGQY